MRPTTLPTLTAFATTAIISGALAQSPQAVHPRIIEIPIGEASDSIHSLAVFDTSSRSEVDAIILRERAGQRDVIQVNDLDGIAHRITLATNVDYCYPLMGGQHPRVLCVRGPGSANPGVFAVRRKERTDVFSELPYPSGIDTIEEIRLVDTSRIPLSGDVVKIQSLWIRFDLHLCAMERSNGTIDTYAINCAEGAEYANFVGSVDPAAQGISNVQDWTLGYKNDDVQPDLLVVGYTNDAGAVGVSLVGLSPANGSDVGPRHLIHPQATDSVVLATRHDADHEITVVYKTGNSANFASWALEVPTGADTLDFGPAVNAADYVAVATGDIDKEGGAFGGDHHSDLLFDIPGANFAVCLMRDASSTSYDTAARRGLLGMGTTQSDPGLNMCHDSNNSRFLANGSGADAHVIRHDTKSGRPVLAIATGISDALSVAPGTSQLSALWTTGEYWDFITDMRITDLNGSNEDATVHLKIDLSNPGYLADLGFSANDVLLLGIERWDQTIPAGMEDRPAPVELNQEKQWTVIPITDLVGNGAYRLELPHFDASIGDRYNAYCTAQFGVVKPNGVLRLSPKHVFGVSCGSETGGSVHEWRGQLAAVASAESGPHDEIRVISKGRVTHSGPGGTGLGNGVGGKSGDGVKKPNGLFPVATANPTPAGGEPTIPPTPLPEWPAGWQ